MAHELFNIGDLVQHKSGTGPTMTVERPLTKKAQAALEAANSISEITPQFRVLAELLCGVYKQQKALNQAQSAIEMLGSLLDAGPEALTATELSDMILREVDWFAQSAPLSDDRTLVILKVR